MTNANLGPRPAASAISFDARCFRHDGVKVEYRVGCNAGSTNYPKTFPTIEQAELYAGPRRLPVERIEVPRMVRVSWT